MKEKEIAEIRRRLQPDRHSITHIYGCYVNEEKEILTTFGQSLGLMPQDECEKYLALFRRCLSGTVNKNLLEVTFTTSQVTDGDEHRLLMDLRNTALQNDEIRRIFYEKVIAAAPLTGNYLILLLHNRYDVPFRRKDGSQAEDSADVYSYIQCAVCPVKLTKSTLAYQAAESEFHNSEPGWAVSPPELGFLFPAFDERATNIYNALYFTRDTAENHDSFVEAVFRTELPMPAAHQKDTFQSVLGSALGEACTLDAVKGVHEQLCQMIQLHKESKDPEPLVINEEHVEAMLESSGISEEKREEFSRRFDAEFGESADLSPKNIIDPKKLEVVTPDVQIRIAPGKGDLLQTRILGGVKYLLIRAEENVEVNGVPIFIQEPDI